MAEARAACDRLAKLLPGVTVSAGLRITPFTRAEDEARWAEGRRRAGMPE